VTSPSQANQNKEVSRTVSAHVGKTFWPTGKFIPSQGVERDCFSDSDTFFHLPKFRRRMRLYSAKEHRSYHGTAIAKAHLAWATLYSEPQRRKKSFSVFCTGKNTHGFDISYSNGK
jgi:hypothetical protein